MPLFRASKRETAGSPPTPVSPDQQGVTNGPQPPRPSVAPKAPFPAKPKPPAAAQGGADAADDAAAAAQTPENGLPSSSSSNSSLAKVVPNNPTVNNARRNTDSTASQSHLPEGGAASTEEEEAAAASAAYEARQAQAIGAATAAAVKAAVAADALEEAREQERQHMAVINMSPKPPVKQESFLRAGLSDREVLQLRQTFGYNEVKPHQKPEWAKIVGRYFGLVPLILITAALFSVFVKEEGRRDWLSFGMLLFLCNVMIWADYLGERSARNAIAAVEKLAAPSCLAQRNGKWISLPVRELLPGDLVRLRGGVVVPADGVFVSRGGTLLLDESALTGESLPSRKYAGGELLSGAVVQQGEGEMRVTKIGAQSFYGKTISLLARAERGGHLRGVLNRAAKIITLIASLFAFFLFFWLGWYPSWKLIIPDHRILISLKRAFILVASVAPAAMPVVTTTVLAVGSLIISRENGLVSRLSAIEEAAGVMTLCSDKTGTLTKNQLTLSQDELAVQPGYSAEDVLLAASLASTLTDPEPIDRAINEQADLEKRKQFTVKEYVPFNPVDKRTVSTVETPEGRSIQITKGAPSVIADLVAAPGTPLRKELDALIIEKAKRGFRTLGVAERDLPDPNPPTPTDPSSGAPSSAPAAAATAVAEARKKQDDEAGQWRLCGYISLFDPPREDTKETLNKARQLGIKVKMVTGDQQAIAVETAKLLGIGTNIVGPEVWKQKEEAEQQQYQQQQEEGGAVAGGGKKPLMINGTEYHQFVEAADGFAGVYPEHKFAIVEALLETNQLVAMTGDGVNDAPALKRATVGVAVSGATDAAKAAADIILLAPGLSTIITVLSLSRQIFRRVESYIIFRLFTSFIVLVFWTGVHVILDYMFPAWILVLVSMINDFVLMSCSRDNVPSSRTPLIWSMARVTCVSLLMSFICGASIVAFVVFADPMYGVDWWPRWGLSSFRGDWFVPGHSRPMSTQTNAAVWLLLTLMVQANFHAARTKGFFWKYGDENRFPSLFVLLPQLAACLVTLFLSVYWKYDWKVGSGARMSGLTWGQAGVTVLWALMWFLFTDCVKVYFYRMIWPELQHVRCIRSSHHCLPSTEGPEERRVIRQLREINNSMARKRNRARDTLHAVEEKVEDQVNAAGIRALRQISRMRTHRAATDEAQMRRHDLSLRKTEMHPVAKRG
ncbi:hypothetical protein Emed_000397 [Eimeria media]